MPAAAAIPVWALVTSAVAPAAAAVAGSAISAHGASKAAQSQANTASQAIDYQKQQDELNRQQYMKEYQRQVDLQNRQIAVEDARRAQVNSILFGGGNSKSVADLIPGASTPTATPRLASTPPPMPTGWKSGDPIPGAPPATGPATSRAAAFAEATGGLPAPATPARTVADLAATPSMAAGPLPAPNANGLASEMWNAPQQRRRTVADLAASGGY